MTSPVRDRSVRKTPVALVVLAGLPLLAALMGASCQGSSTIDNNTGAGGSDPGGVGGDDGNGAGGDSGGTGGSSGTGGRHGHGRRQGHRRQDRRGRHGRGRTVGRHGRNRPARVAP